MAFILYDERFCAHAIATSAQDALNIAFWDINAEWKITRVPNWQYRGYFHLLYKKIEDPEEKWTLASGSETKIVSHLENTMTEITYKALKYIPVSGYCARRLGACPIEDFESVIKEQNAKREISPKVEMNFVIYKQAFPLEWKVLFKDTLPEIFVKNHPELVICTISEYQKIVTNFLDDPKPIRLERD